jgi:hypothetical protein
MQPDTIMRVSYLLSVTPGECLGSAYLEIGHDEVL